MQPQISIVIPVYKVEEYLKECLDSIVNQTFKNFEVLCVDDGSPDNCGKILDEYAKKDKRFKIFHQENKGLSVARNRALDKIKGQYLMFADSDDVLHEKMLETAINFIEKNKVDMAWFEFENFDKNCNNKQDLLNEYNTEVINNPLDLIVNKRKFLFKKNVRIYDMVWNKIYRTEVVKNIRFAEKLSPREDNLYILEVISKIKNMAHIPDKLYFYRNNSSSVMHNLSYEKIMYSDMNFFKNLKKMQKRSLTDNNAKKNKLIEKMVANAVYKIIIRGYCKIKDNVSKEYETWFKTILEDKEIKYCRLNLSRQFAIFKLKRKLKNV